MFRTGTRRLFGKPRDRRHQRIRPYDPWSKIDLTGPILTLPGQCSRLSNAPLLVGCQPLDVLPNIASSRLRPGPDDATELHRLDAAAYREVASMEPPLIETERDSTKAPV